MKSIIINSFVFVVGLIVISQYMGFFSEKHERITKQRYAVLGASLILMIIGKVSMSLSFGSFLCDIFYAVVKFADVVFMIEVMLLTEDIVHLNKKYTSLFISIIGYSSVILFLIDILNSYGALIKSDAGVFYRPATGVHQVLYVLVYLVYVVALLTSSVYMATFCNKRRERRNLILLFLTYAFTILGYIGEVFITIYEAEYVPIAVFMNLFAVVFMRHLLTYNRSILILESDFAEELSDARTDIVLILDDEQRVIMTNKRAEVFGQIIHDSYVGRQLSDIFRISEESVLEITRERTENSFGVGADYVLNGNHVNMVVQHRLDYYEEILATVVTVYNMEVREKFEGIEDTVEDYDENLIKSAVSLTKGGRVLIIDEDIAFLSSFQTILKPYEVNVIRAIGGADGVAQITNGVFDIVFCTHNMKQMNGTETVKRIRNLPGEYYNQVPVVFITDCDINEVYGEFLEAGFNDYLVKPIRLKDLNSVLTRWLWQRFDKGEDAEAEVSNPWSGQYAELKQLLDDSVSLYALKKYDLFKYCINGIKRICAVLELEELRSVAADLENACMFKDTAKIDTLFKRLESGINAEMTIKG